MLNVSRVINDHRVCQEFTIYRKKGEWKSGRFIENETNLTMTGVISVATPKDLESIPEGDRVGGEVVIHSTKEIFVTHKGDTLENSGTSDELLWHGERYKIYSLGPYSDYGYYKAIAMRKASC